MGKIFNTFMAILTAVGVAKATAGPSDQEINAHGHLLQRGNIAYNEPFKVAINGSDPSSIRRTTKKAMELIFKGAKDANDLRFLGNSVGDCIKDGIEDLVKKANMGRGDTIVIRANIDKSFDLYDNKDNKQLKTVECKDQLDKILNKYATIQGQSSTTPRYGASNFMPQTTPLPKQEGAQIKSQSYDQGRNLFGSKKRHIARHLAGKADKFAKKGDYEMALKYSQLAAGHSDEYNSKVPEMQRKYSQSLHNESAKQLRTAENEFKNHDIDDAIEAIVKAFNLEDQARGLNQEYSLQEEGDLRTKIANYALEKMAGYMVQGQESKAEKIAEMLVDMGVTQQQIDNAYAKQADRLLK